MNIWWLESWGETRQKMPTFLKESDKIFLTDTETSKQSKYHMKLHRWLDWPFIWPSAAMLLINITVINITVTKLY